MSKKGVFAISIDTELAWGSFDRGGIIKYKDAYGSERSIISRILDLFKRYDISATWAIVGHLFLNNCKKEKEGVHPDIVRPNHRWFKKDWFSLDPATDLSKDNFWYASDVVGQIRRAQPKQEIASHSFCHPIFSDKGCTRKVADSDIAKCVELAEKEGIKLKTFVFPRNAPAYLDILLKYGFKVFRAKDNTYCSIKFLPKTLKKIYFLLSDVFGLAPPVVFPEIDNETGLVRIPSSMLFRFAYGTSRFIPAGGRFKKAKKGIDGAIAAGGIFHLWFHPMSFAWKRKEMLNELEEILRYARSRANDLEVATLGQIGENFLCQRRDYRDEFNPEGVVLHNRRSDKFREEYSAALSGNSLDAFRYGRIKIESALLSFLDSLGRSKRILDVGCGTGYYLNLVRRRGFDCAGLDRSQNMLRQLKDTYPDLPVQMADARKLPFKDNSYDAVISIETLRYFSDRNPLLAEIYRVVKPGGLIFITAAPLFSLNFYGIFNSLCRVFKIKRAVSCFQSFETAGSIKARLVKAGFSDIRVQGYFFGPYFLLDKICPKVSAFLISRFSGFDNRLSRYCLLKNLSNHLVIIARRPSYD